MSNVIPMVSASPPPLDDDPSFGYDDDDDFGNFTGADDSHESSPGPPEPPPFEADWSNSWKDTSTLPESPQKGTPLNLNENSNGSNSNINVLPEPIVNGTEDFGDFANFQQDTDVLVKKPHIENLPITSACDAPSREDENIDIESNCLPKNASTVSDNENINLKSPSLDEKETVLSSIKTSRDSTTDSGMFSTDISPVPKSEDTAEFCDKTDSDNEDTFPDLPKDKMGSTEDLSASEMDQIKDQSDTIVLESETRTSPGGQSSSFGDDCVSDVSKDEESEGGSDKICDVKQENVPHSEIPDSLEICDNISNNDKIASCVSNDQNVSSMGSHDGSSQNVSQFSNSAQSDDEDDWGEFDSGDNAMQENTGTSKSIQSKEIIPEGIPDTIEQRPSAPVGSEDEAGMEAEDDCLEAIDEALKDSVSMGVYNPDDPGELDLKPVCDMELSDEESNSESRLNTVESPTEDSLSQEEDSCNNDLEQRTDGVSRSVQEREDLAPDFAQDEKCDDGSVEENEWNAFADFGESGGDDGDGWAEFQDPPPASDAKFKDSSETSEEFGDFDAGHAKDDDFGAFGTAGNDGDDWAGFEGGETSSPQVPQVPQTSVKPQATTATTIHSRVPKEKLEKVLASCFPPPPSETFEKSVSGLSHLEVLISTQLHRTSFSWHISKPQTRKPQEPHLVWNCLQNLDKTNALLYQWSNCLANKQMFKTLRIDTQNILFGHKKQSVPIFASNIGLLEPIRGPVGAKPLQPQASPTLVDPDKQDDPSTQELPPVEFDWDTSGLTNPLAAKTLDLDFLSVQESECVNKNTDEWDWVFQSEILDAPRSSVKSLPPLEDVLKNMKVTSTTTRRRQDEHLSDEAGRIVDSLPLLSFMTSKVLMFPLKQ